MVIKIHDPATLANAPVDFGELHVNLWTQVSNKKDEFDAFCVHTGPIALKNFNT